MANKTTGGSIARRGVLLAGMLVVAAALCGLASTAAQTTSSKQTDTKGKQPDKKVDQPKVITDQLVENFAGQNELAFINEEIEKGWKDNKIEPAERCSDYEFIRRASLDLIGRIAKVKEIEVYMADPPAKRRSLLIDRLLASPEFANHFGNIWTNLLLTRTGGKLYHEQMHLWLEEQFDKQGTDSVGWDKIVTKILTATGKTNDNGAVNYILAHLGEQLPNNDRGANGAFEMVPVTSRTTRLFLGLRTQCTQCHDHPFNDEWQQAHFWGINAFFRQVDAPTGRPTVMVKKKGMMNLGQLDLLDNPNFNKDGIVGFERRNGTLMFTKAKFLDGRKLPAEYKGRREELAKFVVSSPYFAKAFVNRTWGHFMGRAFTKEPDDFGDHSPVSHPELLDRLSKDWATKYNHDPRVLIRWICNSKPYGLASVANKTNDKSDDEKFFSRMLLKALSPEQLFESLMVATEAKVGQTKDNKRKLREDWLTKLIVNFGDDEGSEGNFNGTVVQALLMMNGQDINTAIMDKDNGTVAVILKKANITPQKAMHDLYLAALNRPPSPAEYSRILSPRMMNFPRLPNTPRDRAFFTGFYQDLFWALLNSNEFILNH
jgi:hypothetical protein